MSTHLILIANSKDATVSWFRLVDGTLTALTASPTGVPGPLAVDPVSDVVYAGVKEPAAIQAFRLDRATTTLTELDRYATDGVPVYLTLSPAADRLAMASYHQGLGQTWTITDEVGLCPTDTRINFPNLHSVQVSADGRFAYFVSLHDDLIAQFAFGIDGSLTPLDPPTVAAPTGSGPRHIILDAAQTSAYVVTEFSGEALHYRRDPASGALSFVAATGFVPPNSGLTRSRFGADPRAEDLIWGSDLHLDAAGKLLYCAERTRGTISALPIGPEGALSGATAHSTVVPQPRSFAVLPNGQLLVASEIDRVVARYRADTHGALSEIDRHEVGLGANWIEVIEA